MTTKKTIDFHGKPLSIEVGKVAKQANGSAYIQYGETVVLVTACAMTTPKLGIDFLPLSVDYFERYASAGKIPGGFFKREGRPTEREILTSRLCDRPIRPLFPETYQNETQITAMVMSYDKENESDTLAVLGTSCALHVSDIPFHGPVAAVRVGRIDGKLVCNANLSDMANSDIDMLIACSKDAIVMVEGGAGEVPEGEVLEALMFGFESAQPLITLQEELRKEMGKEKWAVTEAPAANPLRDKVQGAISSDLAKTLTIQEKMERYSALKALKEKTVAGFVAQDPAYEEQAGDIKGEFEEIVRSEIRKHIVDKGIRIDTRKPDQIRDIWGEVGVLPRVHGSALFTRGETQAMVTATLGTTDDEQRIDSLKGESKKKFMLHYNFPPFSVGEVKPQRGPGRREIGHGALASRAIERVLPSVDGFPYTMRVVSDILESHGSSSMATVCGTSMSLMDAGVPIKAPVAGIAMGLIKEGEKFFILSDISGDEDHIGDMDFKVAGTSKGVTAIQMDIKVRGISRQVLEQALTQAREGRMHILGKMAEVIAQPRPDISKYAPRIETIMIKQDKIRELIGPGGKVIRGLVEETGAKIEVDDSGKVTIFSADLEALKLAKARVEEIAAVPEIGKIYQGTVRKIMEYGAFVQVIPGTDGLLHVSEIHSDGRIENVNDVLKEGDMIEVKVMSVDNQGKIKLSNREVVVPGSSPNAGREDRPRSGGGGRDRGPSRDRGRGGEGRGRDDRPRSRERSRF
jgi:polyribonucleotide nucleotidyltransferase